MMKIQSWYAVLLVWLIAAWLAGCGTLEVGFDDPPSPIGGSASEIEMPLSVRAVQDTNVRRGLGPSAPVVGTLTAGQEVSAIARIMTEHQEEWLFVLLPDGVQGMVYAPLVEPVGNIANVPDVSNITLPIRTATSLGKIAYLQGGDIWVKALSDDESARLTHDGRNRSPRWSASGEWLAFLQGEFDQLWLMRADGSDAYRVGPAPGAYVAWSPTEEQLAYVSPLGLEILNAGETNAETLVAWGSVSRVETLPITPPPPPTETRSIGGIAWSPDGDRIGYLAQAREQDWPNATHEVRVVEVASGESQTIFDVRIAPEQGELVLHAWTGDGRYLLVWQAPILAAAIWHGYLYAIPATGGEPIVLQEDVSRYADFVRPAPGAQARVAVIRGGPRETWTHKILAILGPGEEVLETPPNEAISSPAWHPDGTCLAYASMPDVGNWVGSEPARQAMMARKIWTLDLQAPESPQQLTNDPAYRDEYPLWSADGSHILFARLDNDSRASLWLVAATGGEPRQVVPELTPAPEWFGYYGYIREWPDLFDWHPGNPVVRETIVEEPRVIATVPVAPSVRTLGEFWRPLNSEITAADAMQLWGEPDKIMGSGLLIYQYQLEEDIAILLGFPGEEPILYARLEGPSGELTDLPYSGARSEPVSGIVFPAPEATINGTVSIIGTAVTNAFQKYELHYKREPSGDEAYIYFDGGATRVIDDELGIWHAEGLRPGIYSLRLRVVRTTGDYVEYYIHPLYVNREDAHREAPVPASANEPSVILQSPASLLAPGASTSMDLIHGHSQ